MRFMVIAAATAALWVGAAQAVTLDFVAEAAGAERGVEDGTTINFGGLDVTFSAGPGGLGSDFAYFDDLSGGRPAGLGVCTNLTATMQCTPSNDDNVHADESVTLAFRPVVSLSNLEFYDAEHFLLDSASLFLEIAVDGVSEVYSFAEAIAQTFVGRTFTFAGIDEQDGGAPFYISSVEATPVPVPAAGLLLLGALGGLGFARRRTA